MTRSPSGPDSPTPTMTERDAYVENMKLELDELNERLHSFETKVTHARQDAQDRYVFELAKLRRHSRSSLTQWELLRASTEATWHQHVSEMEHFRDAFIHAFHDFRARL